MSAAIDTVSVWRIAVEGRDYSAEDRSGKGAEITGGRWNREGLPVLYAAENIALACLETLMHLGSSLPLNRYLVRIELEVQDWKERTVFDPSQGIGWDAEPYGQTSLDWGSRWLESQSSLLAAVPSSLVPEESNILLNPRHPRMATVRLTKLRRWLFDPRFRA